MTKKFILQDSPGFLLRRCHQRSREIFDELIGTDTRLSRQQVAVLLTIQQNPGATQARLAEVSRFDRNTLAELLPRLIDRKLVVRRRSSSDGRSWEISLSAAAERLLRSVHDRLHEVQSRILEPLPGELRPVFMRCLKILSDATPVTEDDLRAATALKKVRAAKRP